ncbi:hypothetical protein [Acinetobacter gyllenbergii]|uniref:hypothetical protein n=1 Tax=Acinetobacter gyllenbergii TaxID=134534 RepID=UPI000806DF83|nr:hypothetical protein [Acinetobacter gyllenbergii]OBY74629.1 hypothetical protein NG55_06690 [Acinetobacter gyllenbergii]
MVYFINRGIIFFFLFSTSFTYAENKVKLNENQCVDLRVNYEKLDLYLSDCVEKINKIDTIEVPNDIAKIEYSLFNKNNLYIAFSYDENYRSLDNKYSYVNKYFLINAYDCNEKNNCKYNSALSNYFGNGGDVFDRERKELVYRYPYSRRDLLMKELSSDRFNNWMSGKIKKGKVVRKTFVNEVNNVSTENNGYLIKGDIFEVEDISSGWLNVKYTSKVGKITKGWVNCKDTNICD